MSFDGLGYSSTRRSGARLSRRLLRDADPDSGRDWRAGRGLTGVLIRMALRRRRPPPRCWCTTRSHSGPLAGRRHRLRQLASTRPHSQRHPITRRASKEDPPRGFLAATCDSDAARRAGPSRNTLALRRARRCRKILTDEPADRLRWRAGHDRSDGHQRSGSGDCARRCGCRAC